MSTSYGERGPGIVKDGLQVYLNSKMVSSYGRNNTTTWRDISGNGHDFTLDASSM